MQGPAQCNVALHVPLQTGSMLADFCSCRAETLPAQRTSITSALKSVILVFLFMACFPLFNYQTGSLPV